MNITFLTQTFANLVATAEVDSVASNITKPLNMADIDMQSLRSVGAEWLDALIGFGIRTLIAIIAFVIGRWLIKKILNWVDGLLKKKDLGGVAISLFNSIFEAILYFILLVVIARVFGASSVSFAALLASLGLAIGMALSGQLQNLAGGIIILLTKPFDANDFIEAQSVMGTVIDITLFHTLIKTADNKMIFVPNGVLSSGLITNYSRENLRRVDFTIGVEYGEDFDRVKDLLLQLAKADSRIKQTPEPVVFLSELADSSVNLSFRVWTEGSEYWGLYFDFNKLIYAEFNKAGIGFPFPQITVHKAEN